MFKFTRRRRAIAYQHGLRAAELCSLRWAQVELKHGRLHVNPPRAALRAFNLCMGPSYERCAPALGSTAARLMRTYALQMEVLRRLRVGGQQFVRVEHVHVNDGGQALIGNVKRTDR
jgi:integrase